jgi:acyl carrier protein
MTELQQRVCTIVSNIMTVPLASVTLESSPDSVENWDSILHMNLILALEQEFGVSFDDDQVVRMLSVEQIATELASVT